VLIDAFILASHPLLLKGDEEELGRVFQRVAFRRENTQIVRELQKAHEECDQEDGADSLDVREAQQDQ
jgi:hypothetical protein